MKNWNFRKSVIAREDMPEEHRLAQSLSWPHLIALGVGAIVGTGTQKARATSSVESPDSQRSARATCASRAIAG